jgi:hypothetical protein
MRWRAWLLSLIAIGSAAGCAPAVSGPFPENPDLSEVTIALERTECFGSCPVYSIVIKGGGEVTYEGRSFVLIPGRQTWRVPRENVLELIALFRRADFFELDDSYEASVTDLPTFITRLSIGGRQKSVRDYGGGFRAEFLRAGNPMPPIVAEIEDAMDRLSGAMSFVIGDDDTVARLEAAGWRFDSAESAHAFGFLVSACNLPLATTFLTKGAPADAHVERTGWNDEGPAIVSAVDCADAGFVELLESRGALKDEDAARKFLLSSVRAGHPEMVEIALRYSGVDGVVDELDAPLIFRAASANPPRREAAGNARFEPGEVIEKLVAAGADPNAVLDHDSTPLHWAESGTAVRALLKAHANPNVADDEGRTPIFSAPGADAVSALLEHGAKVNVRDHYGYTPLFGVSDPKVVMLLLAAGVDPDVAANDGRTAFLSADSEEAALALVEAGATTAGPGPLLEQRIKLSAERGWTKLVPILQAALDQAGR